MWTHINNENQSNDILINNKIKQYKLNLKYKNFK